MSSEARLISLEVHGDPRFIFEFTGASKVGTADVFQLDGATVRMLPSGRLERKGISNAVAPIFTFLVSEVASAALGALAGRIYRAAKGRVSRLKINGMEVPVNEADILAVLREAQGDDAAT
jgi:hypothetical protein